MKDKKARIELGCYEKYNSLSHKHFYAKLKELQENQNALVKYLNVHFADVPSERKVVKGGRGETSDDGRKE